jgi:membrane fusion protein (multidrug efflux system)
VSRQELDNAVQANLANQALVAAAQAAVRNAQLNLDWTKVTAPITGIAGISAAQIGDLVTPATVLTTVSQVDPIKVQFPISEQQYLRFARRIRAREEGRVSAGPPLTLILANGDVYPEPGRFSAAGGARWTSAPARLRFRPYSPTPAIFCVQGSTRRFAS